MTEELGYVSHRPLYYIDCRLRLTFVETQGCFRSMLGMDLSRVLELYLSGEFLCRMGYQWISGGAGMKWLYIIKSDNRRPNMANLSIPVS